MKNRIDMIREYLQRPVHIQNFIEAEQCIESIERDIKNARLYAADAENALLRILQETQMHDLCFIYLTSALIALTHKTQYLSLLLQGVLCSELLTTQNLEFIYKQVAGIVFRHPDIVNDEVTELLNQVYQCVYQELKSGIRIPPKRQQRRKERVVVMTANFLGERHAPTHSTLERSFILQRNAKKQVMIVSATEGTSSVGRIPFFHAYISNRIKQYDALEQYTWQGESFGFYQAGENINTVSELQNLVDVIADYNPYYVMYVGGRSYVADLINEFCPVVTVSTVFSTIPNCNTAFAMIGRKITEEEQSKSRAELIEVPFSFELTEKKRNYSREELGISGDAFVLAVVGNRLDADVSDLFLKCMEQTTNCLLLFVGGFEAYPDRVISHPWLRDHSVALGHVSDVMGVLECADLYVNPIRLGGGFSVIEGFHAGIPAVSCRYGDVSVAAGEDFCVDSYEAMLSVIRKYQTDKEFYQSQLQRAKAREKEITDGSAGLLKGLQQMEQSPRFW